MKKIVIALFAVAALAFAACSKEEKGPTETPKTTEPAKTEPAKTEPAKTEPAKTEPAAGGGDLPAACNDYMNKMMKCFESDKYPAAAKDAAKQAFEQTKNSWSFAGLSGDALKAAQDAADQACKQASETMKQSAEMMCPGVF